MTIFSLVIQGINDSSKVDISLFTNCLLLARGEFRLKCHGDTYENQKLRRSFRFNYSNIFSRERY